MKLSVLDLCPLLSGKTTGESFTASVELAQAVEQLGYHRFWLAEHHNMEGIGSSSPEVLISHIASRTKTIRVGSGGIMLPNHAPLHIAEIFRTLEALFPGRIDLGVGRAPGSGQKAAHALRGKRGLSHEEFPQDMKDLLTWLEDSTPEKYHDVYAVPRSVEVPQVWMLGSSDFGAQLAGHMGLPYSFAQHFSHIPAMEIFRLYEESFRPSKYLKAPYGMMGCHIICAETDERARELAMSSDLSFALFVQNGKSVPLPTVEEAKAWPFNEEDWKQVRMGGMPKFVGSPETIKKLLSPYLKSNLIQELMVLSMVHDQKVRRKSYEILADIMDA